MCVALLLTVQHSAVMAVEGAEGRHEAEVASDPTSGFQYRTETASHTLVKRDMFSNFEVPAVSWEGENTPEKGQPIMEDRTGLLQLFLFNQAMNTRHPAPVQEEKVVRCYRVPKTQRCTRTQYGHWDNCEVIFARECYMYTYIKPE